MTAEQWLLARFALATCAVIVAWIVEARTTKIPNALTFATATAALFLRGLRLDASVLDWVAPLMIGLAPGYFVFRRGGIGAGAVKLFAAVCACLSVQGAVAAVLTMGAIVLVRGRREANEGSTALVRTAPMIAAATAAGCAASWFIR